MESRSIRVLGAAVAALVMSAAVASAQSLGELAAKEQERREKERQKRGGASKVITENDLRGGGRGTLSNAGATDAVAPAPEASPSPGAAAAKPGEAAREKTPEEIRAEQEGDWRKRAQQARDEEARLASALADLQQKLNNVGVPLYGSGRTAVLAEFDKTKAALDAARQKVADLEEEGRRNSYR